MNKSICHSPLPTSRHTAKALMAATLVLAGIFNSNAADGDMITVDGVTYTVTSETGKTAQLIWDNDASGDDLVIPSHITSADTGNQYAVTSVYERAFAYCEHRSVALPGTLLEIGNEAFRGSFSLEQIVIPNSVETIGEMAFAECPELTSATLSDAMTAVAASLFYNCAKLASATLGSSTTEVRDGAFTGCNLAELYCKATTPPQVNISGAFPAQDFEKCLLYVPTGCKAAYEADNEWDKFSTITEHEFTSGIASIAGAVKISVTAANGTIMIDGTDGGIAIEVYTISGQCLYNGTCTAICGLPAGIYIVKAGNTTTKVIL